MRVELFKADLYKPLGLHYSVLFVCIGSKIKACNLGDISQARLCLY